MSADQTELSPLKRAFLAVQTLQARVAELEQARAEPIAIVGLSCRFPGAANAARYWELLRDGVDAISARPDARWQGDPAAAAVNESESNATRWGGYLPSLDTFDPLFFGIAPREAAGMDPQQRLFLEVCWEALEDAGIAPDRLRGSATGVFVGVSTSDYATMQTRGGDLSNVGTHYASGIAHSIVSGRVSYLLGLNGPSVSLDTACSSSLVAVHLACQSLRTGESDLALAGGVNAIALLDNAIAFARTGMLASDGRCKAFDARADGFVRGEGCGVVVLKRLSRALAEGDLIHAVVRGSAVNQDGASSGMTAPSGPAQEAVIRTALRAADVRPRDVRWVEAHGTGTSLGDPIEVQAIGAALAEERGPDEHVLIGSVKSNIGHLEAAAGVAGLIKIVLALRHGAIPRSLHFGTPNPLIPWERLPVRVNTELTPWTRTAEGPRVAGVSSFGFSGTNAHLVIAEAPQAGAAPVVDVDRSRHVLAWSAPTETALRALGGEYARHIEEHPEESLANVAHAASVGRAHFRHRAALPFAPTDDVGARLREFAATGSAAGLATGAMQSADAPRVVFLFTGQGAQYVGMGRTLYETQPVFRRVLDECDAIVGDALQPRLLDVLFPRDGQPSPIDETAYTQPVLFALEYALATLWQSWGVKPAAVLGHSLGELVAATVAGVMRLEDALRLVLVRGRLGQHALSNGAMGAVMATPDRVAALLDTLDGAAVSIAAFNGPENTVISGPREAVEGAFAAFRAQGIVVKPLTSTSAFHSAAADVMLPEFEAAASKISYGVQRIPVYSNLYGRRAAAGELSNAAYWTRHIREPVQFAASFTAVMADGLTTFLEVGPHTTLLGLGRQCFPDSSAAWLPSLRREHDDWTVLLGSLAQLYVRGVAIDWAAFDGAYARQRVRLPSYPFERQRYWAAAGKPSTRATAAPAVHPLLGRRLSSPFMVDRVFETELSLESMPWLGDHRVLGAAVLPTTAYLEAAWSAARALHGDAVRAIEDIEIFDALVTPEAGSVRMQLAIAPVDGAGAVLRVASATATPTGEPELWRSHASATVSLGATAANGDDQRPTDLAAIQARCPRPISADGLRSAVRERAIDLGPSFEGLRHVAQGTREAIGFAELSDAVTESVEGYHVHPTLLDAALQVIPAALFDDPVLGGADETFMPVGVERFRVVQRVGRQLWSHVTLRPTGTSASPIADVRVFDVDGSLAAEIVGLRLQRVDAAAWAPTASEPGDDALYDMAWVPVDTDVTDAAGESWTAPAPTELAEPIRALVDETAARNKVDAYRRHVPELDEISREFVADALRTLGWAPAVCDRVSTTALADRLGVVPQHRRLFERLLAILAEDGFLARDGGDWIVERPLERSPASDRLADLRTRFIEGAGPLGLLGRAGPALAECLTGRVDPLSLLFPGGSFAEADDLYRRSPLALTANGLARKAVERFIAAAPADAPIRILEIGAGTGGTTSFVLPAFPADRTTYVYTDLSPLFLARAEERMTEYPFIDYRILDIEREPAGQGFEPHSFDLIIAANVLHATRDLAETMAHVRRLMRPGALALMLEATTPSRWIDLTFGLTDGWWRFTDAALRPDYPLIGREAWSGVLADVGFESSTAIDVESGREAFDENILIMARADRAADRWVVLADQTGVGHDVAAGLRAAGHDVVTVERGERFATTATGFTIPAADVDAYRRVLDEVSGNGGRSIAGLVHLWSLDDTPTPDAALDDLHAAEDLGCRSLLYLTQAAATRESAASSRLVVVTRGAQAVGDGDVVAPVHATMWGLAGAIRLELPDVDCLCIDLDPSAAPAANALVGRILARGEPQVAVRGEQWLAARLVRHARATDRAVAALEPTNADGAEARVALVNGTPGVLDGLQFVDIAAEPLGPTDVEIRVTASALNFRDVLIAMGMYPGASAGDRLGGECAGEVVAIGSDVTSVAVGDAVVAMAAGGLGSHVRVAAEHVMPLPSSIASEDAVTVPAVFMTAWHALYDLAELQAGERVLIHAGAGGVGLAAIQLAQRVGAEIFATAGSPAKREFLKSLGVAHVMDSRSVAYVDEILQLTAGRGVDVVLNSLADQHILSSLTVLAGDGRFVELGKRGIWTEAQVAALRPSAKYFIVDLAAVGVEQPEVVGDVLRRVWEALEAGEIQPLPRTTFPSHDVVGAFRFMAQAKHIGKIVVTRPSRADAPMVRADGAYLITGGLGGLGLAVTDWLIERGAGRVVLMGRREPSAETQARIDAWNAGGRRVAFVRGDVSRQDDVARVLDAIRRDGVRLRGVIHSAGVLHDAVLIGQEWENFTDTFGPKVDGSWSLHRLTARDSLDFFVLFSSISALLGSPGQGNHAAANAFMDALAHFRRSRGLPALSIDWGAWSDVGAASERGVGERIGAQGMGTIAPALGIELLERLLADGSTQAAVMPVDWSRFAQQHAGGRMRSTLFEKLVQRAAPRPAAARPTAAAPAAATPALSIRDAAPATRWDMLLERMRSLAARVLGLDAAATLDANRPLQEIGLDSLMAVELRNLMKQELGLERPVAATIVFDHPTVSALTEYVGGTVFGWPPRGASTSSAPPSSSTTVSDGDDLDILDQLERLSPDEVEQMLAKRMAAGD